MSHPVGGVDQGQRAADHHRGIPLRLHEDLGNHGGGGGFAVGAGDADGVGIAPHENAPGLGALEDGNALGAGGGNFRVVIVGGGGADEERRAFNVLRPVADGHGNTLRLQLVGGGRAVHIRPGDHKTTGAEHQSQRTHGDAADAHQMGVGAGFEICFNGRCRMIHR